MYINTCKSCSLANFGTYIVRQPLKVMPPLRSASIAMQQLIKSVRKSVEKFYKFMSRSAHDVYAIRTRTHTLKARTLSHTHTLTDADGRVVAVVGVTVNCFAQTRQRQTMTNCFQINERRTAERRQRNVQLTCAFELALIRNSRIAASAPSPSASATLTSQWANRQIGKFKLKVETQIYSSVIRDILTVKKFVYRIERLLYIILSIIINNIY